jgi:precorrin-6B methylase 1
LQFLWWADIVISARLHLYLISEYIWLKTKVFPYQKKINKMQEVIKKIN